MIRKILIANRGEIACRVIKTAKKLKIKTVAVYSDADKDALFVKQADESYYLGGSQPSASYLDADKIISIAKKSKSTMGWFFGFKLHIVINDQGELMAFKITKGNVDDRKPVPDLIFRNFKIYGNE